ncbi:MAG: tRNA (guanosine(37)-N1)-methyltransferase TrmD [Polyangiaceae bacterium]
MRIDVVTLFPEMFEPFLATSITGRAISCGSLTVGLKQLREHGLGKHRAVDDTPYGGGSGMVMRVDCIVEALEAIDASLLGDGGAEPPPAHRVLLTPQGARLDQRKVIALASRPRLALICGRYEGFDDRVGRFVDEEVSLGDFVLAGGEVAAMAIIDAIARLLPGAVGNAASLVSESHSPEMDGLLEYPQFTRPAVFRGLGVPDVLTSGDHGKIAVYRKNEAEKRTAERRPDLLRRARDAGDGGAEGGT